MNSKVFCILPWNFGFKPASAPTGLPRWLSSKESTCQCRRSRFDPWVGKISWRRKWQLTQVFLHGESQRQWSLVDYSPQGHKELDMTEHACMAFPRHESCLWLLSRSCLLPENRIFPAAAVPSTGQAQRYRGRLWLSS